MESYGHSSGPLPWQPQYELYLKIHNVVTDGSRIKSFVFSNSSHEELSAGKNSPVVTSGHHADHMSTDHWSVVLTTSEFFQR